MRARTTIPGQAIPGFPTHFGNLVGLDLSLTATGAAAISRGMLETTTFTSKQRGAQRLHDLRARLRAFLLTHQPVAVAVEGYSFNSKNSRAHSTGEWGGVARITLFDMGIPFIEVPPASLKTFATGSHMAKKPEVVMNLLKRWGLEVPGEDEADATVAALFLAAHRDPGAFSLTAFQTRALEKFRKEDAVQHVAKSLDKKSRAE